MQKLMVMVRDGRFHNVFLIPLLMLCALQRSHAALPADTVNVARLGITPGQQGDLSNKVTAALASNKGKVLFFPAGTYNMQELEIPGATGIAGAGKETVFAPAADGKYMLHVLAEGAVICNLTIDANRQLPIGIACEPNVSGINITGVHVKDIYSKGRTGGYGIYVKGGSSDVTIRNCSFENIDGVEDGKEGNATGANRGVYAYPTANLLVDKCVFNNIMGLEDGDAIHIQRMGQGGQTRSRISNCKFYNVQKRAIKLQADNVTVENNDIYSSNQNQFGAQSAISVFGSNIIILNNHIRLFRSVTGIEIGDGNNITVTGNEIIVDSAFLSRKARKANTQNGIWLKGSNVTITDNYISAPSYSIAVYQGASGCKVQQNRMLSTRQNIFLNKADGFNIDRNEFSSKSPPAAAGARGMALPAGLNNAVIMQNSNDILLNGTKVQ